MAEPRVVPGLHPVRELLRASAAIDEIRVASSRDTSPVLVEIRELAEAAGVPVHEARRGDLDSLAGGAAHQGIVALAPPFSYADLDTVLDAVPAGEPALLVALDGITDPHNLGSIARTAEAVGAHGLIVPSRRAAGVTPAGEKAAAGALAHLPVVEVTNLTRTLKRLGDRGIWGVGLDADGEVAVHDCALLEEPVVVAVGSEGRGLSRLVGETCDQRVFLPMRGRVDSLNASVAAGITLYAARSRRDIAARPNAP